MRDRDIAASLAAGDPDGLAAAYDHHAAGLYGYCRSLLGEPSDAADAVQDTFIIAAARLGGLRSPDRLRAWLYAIARNECQCRLRAGAWPAQADAAGDLAAAPVTVEGTVLDSSEAELRYLVLDAFGRLSPEDREAAELSRRHGLRDADLAAVLGLPVSQAQALAERTREELDRSLGTLLVAGTGWGTCAGLDALLEGWDGRPTVGWRTRAGRHIDGCEACGARRRTALSPAMLLRLVPLAMLPDSLREHVLWLVPDDSPEAVAYRDEVIGRAGPSDPAGFPAQIAPAGWTGRSGRSGGPAGAGRAGRRGDGRPRLRWLAAAAVLLILAGGVAALVRAGGPAHPAADPAGARLSSPAAGAPGSPAPAGQPVPDPGRPISSPASPGSSAPAARSSAPGRAKPAPSSAPARPAPPRAAPTPKPPPPPPVLSESPGTVPMAETGTNIWTGSFTLSAANGPVSFTVSAPSGVSVSQSGGTVSPGAQVTIRVTYILQFVATFPPSLSVNSIAVGLSFPR